MTGSNLDPEKQPIIESKDVFTEWLEGEGLPIHRHRFTLNTKECEVAPWPRKGDGVKGAFISISGSAGGHVMELSPGSSTAPLKYMADEGIFVLWGNGTTTIWQEGTKQTFEWGPGSLFFIPSGTWRQVFNASTVESARWLISSNIASTMRTYGDEDFVFNNLYEFPGRFSGEAEYFKRMKLYRGRVWETNFIPDIMKLPLYDWVGRGAGQNAFMIMGGGFKEVHVSTVPAGTYKQAHCHGGGGGRETRYPSVGGGGGLGHYVVQGTGYTLVRPAARVAYDVEQFTTEGDFERIDWREGNVYGYDFPGGHVIQHQHFSPDKVMNIYLAMGGGLARFFTGSRWGLKESTVLRSDAATPEEGGSNIPYSEEPPEIHQAFEEECRKNGVVCRMKKYSPYCTGVYEEIEIDQSG